MAVAVMVVATAVDARPAVMVRVVVDRDVARGAVHKVVAAVGVENAVRVVIVAALAPPRRVGLNAANPYRCLKWKSP